MPPVRQGSGRRDGVRDVGPHLSQTSLVCKMLLHGPSLGGVWFPLFSECTFFLLDTPLHCIGLKTKKQKNIKTFPGITADSSGRDCLVCGVCFFFCT